MKTKRKPGCALIATIIVAAVCLVILCRLQLEPGTGIPALSRHLTLNSNNAVLMELNENRDILLDVSGGERIYPASLTKIMTAVVVLDSVSDLGGKVTLEQRILDETLRKNASTAGFLSGESVSIEDLLYGLLLSSGAECAIGLSEHVAGSEEAFAELMNLKAAELGMDGSRFTNATGLHDAKHYSTARDIAVLLDYALKDETFYQIFTSKRHSTDSTNKRPEGVTLRSTMFSKVEDGYLEFRLLGGKTGYTAEAGQCLASLAEKDGARYILVTAAAPTENNATEHLHIDDAVAVFSAIE